MKRKLFIDTGHSVKYPGASGFKSEVDWVRAIADKLEPLLDAPIVTGKQIGRAHV